MPSIGDRAGRAQQPAKSPIPGRHTLRSIQKCWNLFPPQPAKSSALWQEREGRQDCSRNHAIPLATCAGYHSHPSKNGSGWSDSRQEQITPLPASCPVSHPRISALSVSIRSGPLGRIWRYPYQQGHGAPVHVSPMPSGKGHVLPFGQAYYVSILLKTFPIPLLVHERHITCR